MKKYVHTAKWKRCVKKVKRKSKGKYNPYAVCSKSLGRRKSVRRRKIGVPTYHERVPNFVVPKNCAVKRLTSGARKDIRSIEQGKGATIVKGFNLQTITLPQLINNSKGGCKR